MEIRGVTESAFRHAVRFASQERYENNLVVADLTDHHGVRRPRIRARLGVLDGKGPGDTCAPGARRSASGRRGPWACWHAVRDVLNVMFEQHPDAVVDSGIHWKVRYNGLDGFREIYPATAYKQVGSMFSPTVMPDLCECDEWGHEPLSAPTQYVITFPV